MNIEPVFIALFLFAALCVVVWPLNIYRYLTTVWLFALVLILLAPPAEAAPTPEQCSQAAELAKGALEARQAGVTEEVAMEYLRHQGVYSGLPVWAVKQGYDAPADMSAWMLGGFVFGECREREE